jgi:hypothetical protein
MMSRGQGEEERSMRGVCVSVETECNKRTIRDYNNRKGDLSL